MMKNVMPINPTGTNLSPDLRLQSGLSLLHSAGATAREKGRYGNVFDKETGSEEYQFIPTKGFDVSVKNKLSLSELTTLQDANRPASIPFIKEKLARLALHKHTRAGEVTANAFFNDIAGDIGEAGELAVTEACNRLRRKEGDFYPKSSEIVDIVKQVTAEIEEVVRASSTTAPSGITCVKAAPQQEPEWAPPSEAEKTQVKNIISECLKILGAPRE